MKKLFALGSLLLALCSPSQAAQVVTWQVVGTNTATTGDEFAVNAINRVYTNAHSSTTILTNLTSVAGTVSNLLNNLALYPLSGITYSLKWISATQFNIIGAPGQTLAVTNLGDWCTLTAVTNTTGIGTIISTLHGNMDTATNGTWYNGTSVALDPQDAWGSFALGRSNTPPGDASGFVIGRSNGVSPGRQVIVGDQNVANLGGTTWEDNDIFGSRNTISGLTNVTILGHDVTASASSEVILGKANQKVRAPGGFVAGHVHDSPMLSTPTLAGPVLSARTNDAAAGAAVTLDILTNSIVWCQQDGSLEDAIVVGISNSTAGRVVILGNAADSATGVYLYITNESAAVSAAAYGIATPDGRNIKLASGEVQPFIYSAGISRWVPIGRSYSTNFELARLTAESAYITNLYGATLNGSNTITGTLSLTSRTWTSLANGNNAGVSLGTNAIVELSGATTIATICGFAAGRGDDVVDVRFSGAVTNILANQSGVDPAAANRIVTGTGGDIALTNQPAWARLRYRSASSRWEVLSHSD